MTKQYIAFDFETFLIGKLYEEPHGYQGSDPVPVCLSYKIGKADPVLTTNRMKHCMYTWLNDDNVILVGQNTPFDMMVAVKHLEIPVELVFEKYNKGLVRDTMIRENLIALATGEAVRNPGKKYTLAAMVEKYLDKDISATKGEDAWRLRYSELYDVPLSDWPQEAIDYPLDDAKHTLQVFAHQHKQRELFQSNELAQTRAALDLHIITLNSPRVDPEQVVAFKEAHIHQVEAARAPLIKAGIMKWNRDRYKKFDKGDERRGGWSMDTKKLHKVITKDYERRGLPVPKTDPSSRYPEGQVKTDAETLLKCGNKSLKKYGAAAVDIKLIDGFLPSLEKAAESVTQRVAPRYTTILKTGRTSCSKPNLQQLSTQPGSRECYLPEKGHVFVSIDFSSMEMYCLAQTASILYGTTKLLDTLNADLDPHLMVVEDIAGMSYAELEEGKKAKDPLVKKYRDLGKVANFGFGGGMGGATATSNLKDYQYDTVVELFPGEDVVTVMDRLSLQWKRKWELTPMFEKAGRLCRGGNRPTYTCPITGRIKALNTYCQYCNMHFQPIGADALKEALRRVTESCYSKDGYLYQHGVKLAVEIHDEFLMSGPEKTLAQWVPHVQYQMEYGAMKLLPDCKIKTESGICGQRWRKQDIPLQDWLKGQRPESELDA